MKIINYELKETLEGDETVPLTEKKKVTIQSIIDFIEAQ